MQETRRFPFVKGIQHIYMRRIFAPSSGRVAAFEVICYHCIILLHKNKDVHFAHKMRIFIRYAALLWWFSEHPQHFMGMNCLLTLLITSGKVTKISLSFWLKDASAYLRYRIPLSSAVPSKMQPCYAHRQLSWLPVWARKTWGAKWETKPTQSKGGKYGNSEERY